MSIDISAWKTISKKLLIHNQFVNLWEDMVERPNGAVLPYYVNRKEPFSIVIPITGEEVYMVKQYRYTVESISLEFPMGFVEGKGPFETAETELKEETGMTATLKEIGKFWLAPGHTNQTGYVYLATDLRFGEAHPEDTEFLEVEKHSIKDIGDMITKGEILDSPTIVAYHFLEKYLKKLSSF